jgi:anhydro-N-acetylmuramic acid kinase
MNREFYRQPAAKNVIGLMCGTSVDSVDAALCRIYGFGKQTEIVLIQYLEYPVPQALRAEIFKSFQPSSSDVRQISQLNFAIGELFAKAAIAVRDAAGLEPYEIAAIGSHGQTVYHIPDAETFAGKLQRSTLQLGSPAVIAERCQTTVVSDFRSRDMSAGGQGAPLVPYVDQILFSHPTKTRILQNIGGIANFSLLPAGCHGEQAIVAGDSGPGNMVLDAIAQQMLGLPFDPNGEVAGKGSVDAILLTELLVDEYFQLPPPKSTGRERYGLQYTEQVISRAKERGLSVEDLLATCTALTAQTMANHYQKWCFSRFKVDEIIVSGGGARNLTLMKMFKERCPAQISWLQPEDCGVPRDVKEAMAFAILANETLCGLPGNLPSATGASHPVILGSITPA